MRGRKQPLDTELRDPKKQEAKLLLVAAHALRNFFLIFCQEGIDAKTQIVMILVNVEDCR